MWNKLNYRTGFCTKLFLSQQCILQQFMLHFFLLGWDFQIFWIQKFSFLVMSKIEFWIFILT